jgi:DNA-binding SARP family transcriptional activator
LGSFQVSLDDQPVIHFESNKVRALLSYLAVEPDRQHRREFLADLLWPGYPRHSALANLRYSISSLKKHLKSDETSCLHIQWDSLQINPSAPVEVDAWRFADLIRSSSLKQPAVQDLEQALGLYRGAFLEGFCLADSAPFEEWLLLKREQFTRLMLKTLNFLADYCVTAGDYEQAQKYAWRQVEIEPWLEEGYQQLMRSLALGGQRSAALSQFDACRKLLDRELGIEPGRETVKIYNAICKDDLDSLRNNRDSSSPHSLLFAQAPPRTNEIHCQALAVRPFAGFRAELDWLQGCLEQVQAGEGRLVFISGTLGSGKTSLARQFVCLALKENPELVAACGACSAALGVSDACLAFSEVLQMLAGCGLPHAAESQGLPMLAPRLESLLPYALPVIAEQGPELVAHLLSAETIREKARSLGGGLSERIQPLLARSSQGHTHLEAGQPVLFEQFTHVLDELSQRAPLLLLLDDLQWTDRCTTSLLFHLGRRIKDSRVLILALYRPEDLFLPESESLLPLEQVISELLVTSGALALDLNNTDRHAFLNQYLDLEPNLYPQAFRDRLYRFARGNPLLTSEVLSGMQERGELRKDAAGFWTCSGTENWNDLPPRLGMIISKGLQRLPLGWLLLLQAASVQGEQFTAEIAAQVTGMDPRNAIRLLGGPLYRHLRLVQPSGFERVDEKPVSSYRFTCPICQVWLYQQMDIATRAGLHEQVACALESLYAPLPDRIARQVVWHYHRAHRPDKASTYQV